MLSIMADDLDANEVTRLLGVEPDQARRRGVPEARGERRSLARGRFASGGSKHRNGMSVQP